MNSKEFLKWGLVIIGLLIAWRVVGGLVNRASSALNSSNSNSQPINDAVPSYYEGNDYVLGVYGPITSAYYGPGGPGIYGPWSVGYPGNPFYSAPDNPNPWSGTRKGPYRPYPV